MKASGAGIQTNSKEIFVSARQRLSFCAWNLHLVLMFLNTAVFLVSPNKLPLNRCVRPDCQLLNLLCSGYLRAEIFVGLTFCKMAVGTKICILFLRTCTFHVPVSFVHQDICSMYVYRCVIRNEERE